MTADVVEPIRNPWAFCTECGGPVNRRRGDRNWPCECVADVGSVCETWDEFGECLCGKPGEIAAADALQEALEDQERDLQRPQWVIPADVPQAEIDAFIAKFRAAAGAVRVVHLRETTPVPRHLKPRREATEQGLWPHPAPEHAEPGDKVIAQAETWQVPVLIVLVLLIVSVIVGTALVAG